MTDARVILLTGSELRHDFVRKCIALMPGVTVAASFCEGQEKSLANVLGAATGGDPEVANHIEGRTACEQDFFAPLVALAPDASSPVFIPKGQINDAEQVRAINTLQADLIVTYGCSLIRGPLMDEVKGRCVNIHLGLSPYYRGAGTNIWPLVNAEPECVGVTFMHLDEGIDTGRVIHQMRARIYAGDTPHQIGNRVISDIVPVLADIVRNFHDLALPSGSTIPNPGREYRVKDFDRDAVRTLYDNFRRGSIIERYLEERAERCRAKPIMTVPTLAKTSWNSVAPSSGGMGH